MTPGKTRQQAYRRRMQEDGCRQVTVWLDSDAYTALQLLVKSQDADASSVTSDAIRYYHAVTSNKLAESATVSHHPVDTDAVTSDKLEDRILALRDDEGLSLSAIAEREQYSVGAVIKALINAKSSQ